MEYDYNENSLSVEEYADQNGYSSENECLVALVREWSNCNYTDTENDFFAGKLIEMFEESGEWNFEEFISKPETMEQLFSKENGMENLKKLTNAEIEELASNLDWGNPHDDPEEIKESLRTNWEEQIDEESVEAVYEAMCRIWDEKHTWYAVQNDPEDTDWGTGAYTYKEALAMAKRYKEKYGYARIVKIADGPDPVAVEEEVL